MISDESAEEDDKELRSLTCLLLAASFTYLFLILTYVIFILFSQYTHHLYETHDQYMAAKWLWYICSICLMYLNHSVNFFLYCIGGETFRVEFLIMCGCHIRLSPREKVIAQAKKERNDKLKELERNRQDKESGVITVHPCSVSVNKLELHDISDKETVAHAKPDDVDKE